MTVLPSSTDIIELADLPLYWQGRANALGLLNDRRVEPDARTIGLIETYEECAKELRAALSGVAQGAGDCGNLAERLSAALKRHRAADEPIDAHHTHAVLRDILLGETEAIINCLRRPTPPVQDAGKGEAVAWTLIWSGGYGVNTETTFKTEVQAARYASRCDDPKPAVVPLYAAPQPASNAYAPPSREAIARAIFPNAFLDEHEKSPPIRIWTQAMQDAAFETADKVLALFSASSLSSTHQNTPETPNGE